MTKISKLAFPRSSGTLGALALVSAGLISLGCTSSGGGGGTGNGGSSATGLGGSTGAGGTGGAVAACAAAPASGLIADFMGDGGIELGGGITAYGGNAQPSYTKSGGVLTITENNGPASAFQYAGTVIFFNFCVDASAFSGVEFQLSGSYSGCTIQYSTNDAEQDDMVTDPTKGKCTLGTGKCYSPQTPISQVAPNAVTIQEPWSTDVGGGAPPAPLDPKSLTGLQWQFTIPPLADGGSNSCVATLNISDVKFYH
jgi:hypothetical protein